MPAVVQEKPGPSKIKVQSPSRRLKTNKPAILLGLVERALASMEERAPASMVVRAPANVVVRVQASMVVSARVSMAGKAKNQAQSMG